MRRIQLAGCAFALLTGVGHAQEITGIGGINIGMTQAAFLELPEIKSKSLQDAAKRRFLTSDSDLWKKTRESQVADYSRLYSDHYVIYEFKMATGVKDLMGKDAYDTTVEFYADELIHINLNVSSSFLEFKKILTEKYGAPVTQDRMTTVTCQNGFGVKSEHRDGAVAYEWRGKAKTTATLLFSSSNCGKYAGFSYSIMDGSKWRAAKEVERKAAADAAANEAKTKAAASRL